MEKLTNALDFYYSHYSKSESNVVHNLFYDKDLVNLNSINVHFFVVCQKSTGSGDIQNGLKTYRILKKYFPNVKLVVKTEADKVYLSDLYVDSVYTIGEIITMYHQPQYQNVLKLFIICALPIFVKRFDYVPEPKKFLFIDEYNGWRIVNSEDEINPIENPCDCCKYDYDICQKNEYDQQYLLNQDQITDRGNSYCLSSGIGNTKFNLPTNGLHTEKLEIQPLTDNLALKYLTNRSYYFAYFSTTDEKDPTYRYLEDYHHLVQKLNPFGYTIVIVDPMEYLWKKRNLFFHPDSQIEIFETDTMYASLIFYSVCCTDELNSFSNGESDNK